MTDAWRYACPEGHRAVYRRCGEWWCLTCESGFERATDLKHDVEVSA